MNNYYVMVTKRRFPNLPMMMGPYNFKEALSQQYFLNEASVKSIVLRIVVDEDGNEVK